MTYFLPLLQKSLKIETTSFQEIIAVFLCQFILTIHQCKKTDYHHKQANLM